MRASPSWGIATDSRDDTAQRDARRPGRRGGSPRAGDGRRRRHSAQSLESQPFKAWRWAASSPPPRARPRPFRRHDLVAGIGTGRPKILEAGVAPLRHRDNVIGLPRYRCSWHSHARTARTDHGRVRRQRRRACRVRHRERRVVRAPAGDLRHARGEPSPGAHPPPGGRVSVRDESLGAGLVPGALPLGVHWPLFLCRPGSTPVPLGEHAVDRLALDRSRPSTARPSARLDRLAATRSPGREDQGHRSPSSAARTAGDTSASADRAACCRWERTPARSPRHRAWSTRSGRATRPAPPRRLCGPDTRPAAGEGPPRTCGGRSGPSGPRRAPAAAAWSSTTWWTAKALAYPCITRKVTPEVSRIGASVPRTVPFSGQTSTREGWSQH